MKFGTEYIAYIYVTSVAEVLVFLVMQYMNADIG